MDPIPAAWPPHPAGGDPRKRVVPLFPLLNVWLFPYVVLPLHVSEERYRRMIEDSLDGPGRIVLGTVAEEHKDELAGSPPVLPVAGLGEIGRHQRLPDGGFQILLVGLQRVRVREVPSDRPYRRVEIEPVIEVQIRREHEPKVRADLVAAILERTEKLTAIPPQVPTSHLADLLALRMPLPPPEMNRLYGELDVEARARAALELHARLPGLE
ncbi:MAG: LON peptidase substrate-binding domain-containing protein [Planctomycetota bacterium]